MHSFVDYAVVISYRFDESKDTVNLININENYCIGENSYLFMSIHFFLCLFSSECNILEYRFEIIHIK